ncbi:hypothetical protein BS78_08G020600 [Paspalum vaginatum]|nr:hypothetical protein BS78_08G020600 [Paspalum vaginatum]
MPIYLLIFYQWLGSSVAVGSVGDTLRTQVDQQRDTVGFQYKKVALNQLLHDATMCPSPCNMSMQQLMSCWQSHIFL